MSPMHSSNVSIESDNDVEVEGELTGHLKLLQLKEGLVCILLVVALQPILSFYWRFAGYGKGVGHHKVGQ